MGLTNIRRTPTARTAAAIAAAITILWNAAAIARIFELAFALQLDELIRAMLEAYEKFMSAVFRYIDPLVKSALAWAGFEVNLWPHWKHVFALMMLYFVMHSRSAWLEGNIGAARFVAVWGFIVAFASSVAAGLVHSDAGLTTVLFAVPPVVGLVVYGAGTSARAATWFRGSDEKWAKAFAEFFRHSRRFAIAGLLAIVVVTVLVSAKLTPDWLMNPGMALLLVLYCALALYRIVVGPRWGRYKVPNSSVPWWAAAKGSSEARIGLFMLISLVTAMSVFLVSAFQ